MPGLYILLNSKRELLYETVFESIIRNILKTSGCDLNFETIVTNQEIALINSIKKVFPKSQRISCLFHYKQNILRNLKSYGLARGEGLCIYISIIKCVGHNTWQTKGLINLICNLIKFKISR